MKNQRIEIIKELVKEAGEIALRRFGKTRVQKKPDQSLVTDADLEVSEYITHKLMVNFPEYGIINEESSDEASGIFNKYEYVWVIDPIDGTASYSGRMPVWGVAISLMRKMEPILGIVYLPVTDEIYYTDEDLPAIFETRRWGSVKMDISYLNLPFDKNSLLLTISYAHRRLNIDFPGKNRSLGSTSAHICYVARGDAVGAVVKGSLWDIVPGFVILKKAGGKARYIDGQELDFEELMDGKPTKDFLLFASPSHIETLEGKITKKT